MQKIPVFYSDFMVAEHERGFSPSAYKPKLVVESWLEQEMPIEIHQPQRASIAQLSLAHDPSYLREVLALKIDNGFGTRTREVADTLPYTTGSMLSAANHVMQHGGIACSLTSGFHHAGYNFGGGFCTFNGLMVTALALKQAGKVQRAGILDCDYHFGDGTVDIIKHLNIDWITHYTNTQGYTGNALEFLEILPDLVKSMVDCDIILYQAGADPHIDDPLGGFLTSDQMRRRDRIVFQEAKSWNIPLVWNLAGGYQVELFPSGKTSIRKVLDLHDTTMRQCIFTYIKP